MIPKVKLLFISGPNKGQKYLLEPSLDLQSGKGGKQDFYISSSIQSDICVPNVDIRAVISFRPTHGWILQMLGASSGTGTGNQSATKVFWYLRNQGMAKDETVKHDLIPGTYQTMEHEVKIKF